MFLNKIKYFFSKKKQVKKIYYDKNNEKYYFTLMILNNELVNPYIIIKSFLILKKLLPENDFWWTAPKYWYGTILYFLMFFAGSLVFSIMSNWYISAPIIIIGFFCFLFHFFIKILRYIDFCSLILRDKNLFFVFENWICKMYSENEKEIILKNKIQNTNSLNKKRL